MDIDEIYNCMKKCEKYKSKNYKYAWSCIGNKYEKCIYNIGFREYKVNYPDPLPSPYEKIYAHKNIKISVINRNMFGPLYPPISPQI